MNKDKKNKIILSHTFILLIKILSIIYIILSIISVYISLHCNSFFSMETIYAIFIPYIYLPFRYYFKEQCKNMPIELCFN
jgi:hypothetical protein